MRMIIRVDNDTCSDIIMPDEEIISGGVQIICLEFECINPLFVLIKPSQMELLLHVHDLDPARLISSSKDITVFPYGNRRNVLEESVDLTDGLLFVGIYYFYVTALS